MDGKLGREPEEEEEDHGRDRPHGFGVTGPNPREKQSLTMERGPDK